MPASGEGDCAQSDGDEGAAGGDHEAAVAKARSDQHRVESVGGTACKKPATCSSVAKQSEPDHDITEAEHSSDQRYPR
jgi:hypothetical protein